MSQVTAIVDEKGVSEVSRDGLVDEHLFALHSTCDFNAPIMRRSLQSNIEAL